MRYFVLLHLNICVSVLNRHLVNLAGRFNNFLWNLIPCYRVADSTLFYEPAQNLQFEDALQSLVCFQEL